MPPFRPLSGLPTFEGKSVYLLYDVTHKGGHTCESTLKMTLTDISKFQQNEESLTLTDLPEEYLEVTLCENDAEQIENIEEPYPLAITDVTTESILDSKKLSQGENVKEIYSIELSTNYSSFKPGDTIGIITRNREEDVEHLSSHLGILDLSRKKCRVTVKNPPLKKTQIKPAFLDKVTTLNHIFTHWLDIQSIPKKSFIRVLSEFTKDSKEKRQLEELCSKEKSELYTNKILEANKTFLDVLFMYKSCCPPVARVIENLPKLTPRSYSIASSPLASPNRIKIVFSVVNSQLENVKKGLCTEMLKQMINCPNAEKKVNIFFRKPTGFNLPETNVPLILVGPGTGIAPFLGFLEHLKVLNMKGTVWLFFGCRSKTGDYIFQKELEKYLEEGVITKLCVAFSRDCDSEAKYVQDNIRKYGKEITQLMFEENALIYVCGDAKNMRKDVQNSFSEVFEKHKGMTNKEATDYIKKLQKERRYLQDIWM